MTETLTQLIGEILTGVFSAFITAYMLRLRVTALERRQKAMQSTCEKNHPKATTEVTA